MKKLTYAVMMLLSLGVMAACSESDDDEKDATPNDPIVGTWLSAGTNVAPLLNLIFASSGGVDTISAIFNADNSYKVKQINKDRTTSDYAGTFVITKSTSGNVHKILLNQTAPTAATSLGIYEIFDVAVDSMKYEVVLDNGTNVPPTPTTGFGSTNGGIFGTKNIQKYVRIK